MTKLTIKSDDDAETIKKFSHLAGRPHPCMNHSSNSVFRLVCASRVCVSPNHQSRMHTRTVFWANERSCMYMCVCVYLCVCVCVCASLWIDRVSSRERCMVWCSGRVCVSKRQSLEAPSLHRSQFFCYLLFVISGQEVRRGREKIQTGLEEEELPGYWLSEDENWTKD